VHALYASAESEAWASLAAAPVSARLGSAHA
jgi:hypothetical protein